MDGPLQRTLLLAPSGPKGKYRLLYCNISKNFTFNINYFDYYFTTITSMAVPLNRVVFYFNDHSQVKKYKYFIVLFSLCLAS